MIDARNAILIAVVLVLVGIIGYWLPYQQSKEKPASVNTPGQTEVGVEYAKRGFEPQTITIPVGTTVIWSDTSGRPMWVASDPHPAHTDLRGFDQRGAVTSVFPLFVQIAQAHGGTGTYHYTFAKTGTWKYHNHLSPGDRGTVVVTEK